MKLERVQNVAQILANTELGAKIVGRKKKKYGEHCMMISKKGIVMTDKLTGVLD